MTTYATWTQLEEPPTASSGDIKIQRTRISQYWENHKSTD
jgi:hypothetical protein